VSDSAKTGGISATLVVLILSVAINGLLAGLVLSNTVGPRNNGAGPPPAQTGGEALPQDARRMVRHLSNERRREVIREAFGSLDIQRSDQPRALFVKRQEARQRALKLAGAEELDIDAIKKALHDVRDLNGKLATQGDELLMEVLQIMTPEERASAMQAMKRDRRDRPRRDRQPRRDRD
jgi:uncharacterized membrane protein